MSRKLKGKVQHSKSFKRNTGTLYEVINSLLSIHLQEYISKTTYQATQTNKDTPDLNRFTTILTALSRILSIMHETQELLCQLSSLIITGIISSLSVTTISTFYVDFSVSVFLKDNTHPSKCYFYSPFTILSELIYMSIVLSKCYSRR